VQVFLETVRNYRLTTEQASTLQSVAKAFAYAEEFTCWPPTVFMIAVTFLETAFFVYHVIHLPGTYKIFCWCAPFGYLYFSYFFYNELQLGAGIDPDMTLTPFSSSILDKTRFKPITF
jgi:hypothetical protein